jgi:branched-chain amino acid transport system permease protein
MKGRTIAVPVALLLLAASLPFWFIQTAFVLDVATTTLIFMSAAIAYNLISGFGGQLSFGHSVFFGLGAYTAALLFVRAGISPWLGLLVGGAVAALVALVVGYATLRLRGVYFVLATFALTLIFEVLATHFKGLTGGDGGLYIPFLGNSPSNLQFENELWYYYVALALAGSYFFVSRAVRASRTGLFLRAIRDDQEAARASGVDVTRAKVGVLCLSAFLTSVPGVLYLQKVAFIDPRSAFGVDVAVQIALPAIAGGLGTVWGPVLGATVLIPLRELLNASLSGLPPGLSLIVYALLVMAVMLLDPQGMEGLGRRLARRFVRRPARSDAAESAEGEDKDGRNRSPVRQRTK